VIEKINSGHYTQIDIQFDDEDMEEPEFFIEQFKWLDLDEDGFKEPYIVVVHESTEKVVRISANFTHNDVNVSEDGKIYKITPRQYFVKYTFVPSTDGNFYDTGFFDILYPINEVINTTLNLLLDAGNLANRNTGFIGKELSLRKKGPVHAKIGEFVQVNASGDDIRKGLVPLNFNGPDQTLFSLLGFMVNIAKEIANIKEVLEGQTEHNMQPTTVMALIEQGLKVFSAIYKRIHRSMSDELQLIRSWNYTSKNPLTGEVLDVPFDAEFFNDSDLNFVPVSDPQSVTDIQKAARAQIYAQFFQDPYHDQMKLRDKYYEAQNLDFGQVRAGQDPQLQQMQQQIQQLMQALQQMQQEYDALKKDKTFDQKLKLMKEEREAITDKAEVKDVIASAIERIAKAESLEEGTQIQLYQAIVEALNGESRVSGMAPRANDQRGI
jgi:chaperonin GroES